MADNDREIRQILGNQHWIKSALAELLENNAAIISNQQTQITTLASILSALEAIRDQHSTAKEIQVALDEINRNIGWMLDKM